MHAQSFVGKAHARQGVIRHFQAEEDAVPVSATMQAAAAPPDIAHALKDLLAAELQMNAAQIDEDTQFVDLGLDSITGVTWIRRINAAYGTRIEATKVYSHPTLRQFCAFVVERVALLSAVGTQFVANAAKPATPAAEPASSPIALSMPTTTVPMKPVATDAAAAEADLSVALRHMLAQELHMPEEEIDAHRQFVDLGLDSITGVTWVRRINAAYGTRIEATKVYSYPTLAEFARFLAGLLPARPMQPQPSSAPAEYVDSRPVDARPLAERVRPAARSARTLTSWRDKAARRITGNDAIAIIGMAGQFPRAGDLDAFWRNIAGGKDCIGTVPPQRWDIERYFSEDISIPGTTNSRWMGVLDDCDAFDPLFFNISPTEAESMDPQQRLMLQNCWHAIENAAIDPRSLSGSRCGVYIGCGATDYHDRSREHRYSTQGFTGASMPILAARISYFLDLQGPCLSIDTACSSSLVAIASACDSLAARNCDLALAGGVAVMAGPMMHVKTGQSGMLSVDGRCFAFDHRANGFVPAEGVGAVVLKRLADAERDGDIVHAVIRGWGVNQDGKTNGITAPNPVSQTRLMRAVYDRFGVDPDDIQLVEAHGTGTRLGDPIEVEGLTQAFRHYTRNTGYCALGSVKGNIGHALYAAGIAGVLKLALAMKHRQLPPAAGFERLNPHIDLGDSPFAIDTALKPWPANASGRRSAVVSSFGFSGTNAHLVLESAPHGGPDAQRDVAPARPALIVLSARTTEQLQRKAQDLAECIAQAGPALALRDIAYTLQTGREAMEERCAFVALSTQQLAEALHAFAAGSTARGMHVGSTLARAGKLAFIGQDARLQNVLIDACLREGMLDKLAELWVDGVALPWEALHRDDVAIGHPPRRVELPLYPFAKERYWLQDDLSVSAQPIGDLAEAMHPLLHVNASTLQRQRYRTTLRGGEFFLRDHRVDFSGDGPGPVLPGVAYLEMTAAAIAAALPERAASERLVLGNIAWWRPVLVNATTTIEIELGVDDSGMVLFEISSGAGDARVLHCQGEAGFAEVAAGADADGVWLATARQGENWSADAIYAAFRQVGMHYGPAHRGLRGLWRADGRVVASVVRPAIADDSGGYHMHPALMDAALQACIGFLPSLQALPQEPSVPFALRSLTLHAPCPPEAVVVLQPGEGIVAGTPVTSCDVSIFAPDGTRCIDMRGFTWRAVGKGRVAAAAGSQAVAPSGPAQGLDEAFYQELLDSISRQEMSAEDAAELGLLS
ncbi:MAG: polyketide synthase dehydratase domain-containing protein, partial [Pseudomonadota bacterium]|nr:polyketide synthase dehydratase domain-containing protein [Pseudomonadota bacterium]